MKLACIFFFHDETGDMFGNSGLVIIILGLWNSWRIAYVGFDFYLVVGLIEFDSNKDLYAIDLNSSELFDMHVCYLHENHEWLECYDVIKDCMHNTCDVF